jgi:hypothetical protein
MERTREQRPWILHIRKSKRWICTIAEKSFYVILYLFCIFSQFGLFTPVYKNSILKAVFHICRLFCRGMLELNLGLQFKLRVRADLMPHALAAII